MNLKALLRQLAFFSFSWSIFWRQRLFIQFEEVFFTFSALSSQFHILTPKKSALSPYLMLPA